MAEKETKDSPPGPPPGEGVVRSPSPEEQTSPSLGRPSQGRLPRRLPPGLAGAWTGGAAALRPAPRRCLAGGCCDCCAGAGAAAGGTEYTEALPPAAGWRQQLHAGAGCAGLPQSASVQRRTAGLSSPPRRRKGRSGTRGHSGTVPCLPPSCQPDTARPNRSWTTMVDIARPRDRAVTLSLVARGPWRSEAH